MYPVYCLCVEKAVSHVPLAGCLYEILIPLSRGDGMVFLYEGSGIYFDPCDGQTNAASIASTAGGSCRSYIACCQFTD